MSTSFTFSVARYGEYVDIKLIVLSGKEPSFRYTVILHNSYLHTLLVEHDFSDIMSKISRNHMFNFHMFINDIYHQHEVTLYKDGPVYCLSIQDMHKTIYVTFPINIFNTSNLIALFRLFRSLLPQLSNSSKKYY